MRSFPEIITDPVYEEPKRLNSYQRFWLNYISDKRDLPFIRLLTIIHLTIIPAAIFLYTNVLSGWQWWIAAIVYFYFSQVYFKGPFGLMLHCLCHRKTFKNNSRFITRYIHWFVCPFFGHLGDGYFSHHMGMHHVEGNSPEDTSCTMGYKRDSFGDFLKYWGKFMLIGVYETCQYLFARNRKKLSRQLSVNEISFFVAAIVLSFINLKATLIILVIPWIFARFVMMLGNWTQHAFVDPQEPANDFASTIICMNTVYNQKCWNDGYHTIHHIRPGVHYTEHPVIFKELIAEFERNRTLVFEKIHYLHVFYYLMTKRYDKLADYVVNINGVFSSKEEVILLMKNRTRKFDMSLPQKIAI